MMRTGIRRLIVQVTRNDGDVVRSGGNFSKKEKAVEDQYIHNKERELAEKAQKAQKGETKPADKKK